MLRAIIVEDDTLFAAILQKKITAFLPNVQIITICNDSKEALLVIPELKPDIVFLDVEMPEMNGFELLNHLPNISFEIIFITAYTEFAYKAFKYAAVDFIVKPCDEKELIIAIEKIEKKKNNLPSMPKPLLTKIALPTADGSLFVNVVDIIRAESDKNYTTIYLQNKEKILISKALGVIEELLQGNNFYRIHHSHLINLNHLKQYVRSDGGYVLLADGAQVPVSRAKKDDFLHLINN